MLAQLESITHYTEQALYYARSEHTEKDSLIREIQLEDVVHQAIAENKYLLRQQQVEILVEREVEKDGALAQIERILNELGYQISDTVQTSYLSMLQKK